MRSSPLAIRARRFILPCLVALLVLPLMNGCKRPFAPTPGASLKKKVPDQPTEDERRLLFAQIVEDTAPEVFQESAIIEGGPFKYLLRSLVGVKQDDLRKQTKEEITFEKLLAQPGLYRGQVVTLPRGVVLEVTQAEVPPEYGLPPGHTVLIGVFVDAARDVYAFRILCSPGSKLFEKLDKGIRDDALPVARLTGYFMKLYARRTGDPKEPPWRKPLLICPEPEFSQLAEPRKVWDDLHESKADRFLGGKRIEAPGAEERLVIDVQPAGDKPRILVDGREPRANLGDAVAVAVAALRKRLPEDQAEHPAAVILIAHGGRLEWSKEIVSALRAAGVKRIAVKSEL